MSSQFKYTKDDNTDRDFTDAIEVVDMEFKINGEYICIEPCGGGAKHLLGDQYIYVDINGDDFVPDARDPIRIGTKDDPFATIERAIGYANSFVTLGGNIYIMIGAGTFYVDDTIVLDHPNKIIFKGTDVFVSSIHFGDSCASEQIWFWYGGNGIIAGGYDDSFLIETVEIVVGGNAINFGSLPLSHNRYGFGGASNGSRGVFCGGDSTSGVKDIIDYITFAIASDATDFGDLSINRSYTATCSGN